MTVLLVSFIMIPAGACFIGQDLSVLRLLKSKNMGAGMQITGEYCAFLTIIMIPFVIILGVATAIKPYLPADLERLVRVFSFSNGLQLIMVMLALSAFAYFVFLLADELVGGIILYVFTALGLCFISGCIYPVYFFPDTVRKFAQYTPQGFCRSIISGCVLEKQEPGLVVLAVYTGVMLFAAYITRMLRLRTTKR